MLLKSCEVRVVAPRRGVWIETSDIVYHDLHPEGRAP